MGLVGARWIGILWLKVRKGIELRCGFKILVCTGSYHLELKSNRGIGLALKARPRKGPGITSFHGFASLARWWLSSFKEMSSIPFPFLFPDRWLACSVLLTIIGGCRPLGTTSSFGSWISCKLGCGCIGCKRNVGVLGVDHALSRRLMSYVW